jgi:methylthioribose-1-phosphate isomerase
MIKWQNDSVSVLDQRVLPTEELYHTYKSYTEVANSITDMVLRGAPLIGVAAAMGIALAAKKADAKDLEPFKEEMKKVFEIFAATRPTAVNLFWAIERMKKIVEQGNNLGQIKDQLEKEAIAIYNDDIKINKQIGQNGHKFIEDGDVVMTHCNAGALATAGYGTALGVIRAAVEAGKKIKVVCCETRPYLQGARLTAWELMKDGIDTTLICDNMAGHFMQQGKINKIIVGADRVALNGDAANKIGTYTHSVLAQCHNIPFYIAAPISTLDANTKSGTEIPIEERDVDEVAYIKNVQIAPEGVKIENPAFDVTPAANISAIITEKGVVENPANNGGIESLLK